MPPRYALLALDLDGTVFDPAGRITEATRGAIADARAAGLVVTICTGRGFIECRHALDALEQLDPVVVAGGSIIACPVTGRTHHRFGLPLPLVEQAVGHVLDHGHPALVLKDPTEAGYDYLVVTGEDDLPLDPVTEWWFEKMRVRTRRVRTLADDPHPEWTVRVGACGPSGRLSTLKTRLAESCGDKVLIHHFSAVVAPDHASRAPSGETLHILELFDSCANKWAAVSRVADDRGITPDRIVAIGDEVNDVCMIEGAGLGIAMANAVPAVKHAARRHTKSNAEDGVAHAIRRVLSGEW